ncbi:hypothetical protein JOE39_001597 [Pseudomonas sp. PvP100]|nr:hypothetical protein [Pseudomonas sp. PvP007]MBP1193618.1 hypothetical protein [Pseudomonas sp. PvP100]
MTLYTFKKHMDTGEHHIFKGEWLPSTDPRQCSVAQWSICQKVTQSAGEYIGKGCMEELQARRAAAELGRSLCGVCISSLYATP